MGIQAETHRILAASCRYEVILYNFGDLLSRVAEGANNSGDLLPKQNYYAAQFL